MSHGRARGSGLHLCRGRRLPVRRRVLVRFDSLADDLGFVCVWHFGPAVLSAEISIISTVIYKLIAQLTMHQRQRQILVCGWSCVGGGLLKECGAIQPDRVVVLEIALGNWSHDMRRVGAARNESISSIISNAHHFSFI